MTLLWSRPLDKTSGQDNHLVSDLWSANVAESEPGTQLLLNFLVAKLSETIFEQDSHRAESSSDGLTTAPKMVINSPCLNSKKELAIPEQTTTGKESTNPLMADSLPKTIMPTKLVKPQGFNLRPNMACNDEAELTLNINNHGKWAEAQGLMHLSVNASSESQDGVKLNKSKHLETCGMPCVVQGGKEEERRGLCMLTRYKSLYMKGNGGLLSKKAIVGYST
ncbi:hypothetical protein Tco_0945105 [Tanacetum coccineum]